MSETFEHNTGDHEDPAATMTWIMGVIGVLIFVVIYLGVTTVYRDTATYDGEAKFQTDNVREVDVLTKTAIDRINARQNWLTIENVEGNKENRWTIPIERSMDIMAEKLKREQSSASAADHENPNTIASNQ